MDCCPDSSKLVCEALVWMSKGEKNTEFSWSWEVVCRDSVTGGWVPLLGALGTKGKRADLLYLSTAVSLSKQFYFLGKWNWGPKLTVQGVWFLPTNPQSTQHAALLALLGQTSWKCQVTRLKVQKLCTRETVSWSKSHVCFAWRLILFPLFPMRSQLWNYEGQQLENITWYIIIHFMCIFSGTYLRNSEHWEAVTLNSAPLAHKGYYRCPAGCPLLCPLGDSGTTSRL